MSLSESGSVIGYGRRRRSSLRIAERIILQGFRPARIADLERKRTVDPVATDSAAAEEFFLSGFVGRDLVSYSRMTIDEALWLAQELYHDGVRGLVITECDPTEERDAICAA